MLARDARSLFCFALICAQGLAAFAGGKAAAQPRSSERARVMFLLPKLEASVRGQLREALEAQLGLVDAELLIVDDAPQAVQATLAERIESLQALAERERADVVLWLDPGRGIWLLHVLDVGQDRMVVRRIDASQQSAAFEAIAVLTREASRSGPAGIDEPPVEAAAPEPARPPAEPVAPKAESAATSPPQPEPPAPLATVRLSLFYSGVDFAKEADFSHAAGLSGRLDWRSGLFFSAHASWAALAKPPGPLVVQRIPLGAATGYRIALIDQLWADLELGVVVDLLQRTTRPTEATQVPTSGRLRVAVALAPRLRAEYRPTNLFGVFGGFGLDVGLTTVPYKVAGALAEQVLTPNRVRPVLEAGFAFYP